MEYRGLKAVVFLQILPALPQPHKASSLLVPSGERDQPLTVSSELLLSTHGLDNQLSGI